MVGDNAIRTNSNYSWPEGATLLVTVSSLSVFIVCLVICNTCSDTHGFLCSSWPFVCLPALLACLLTNTFTTLVTEPLGNSEVTAKRRTLSALFLAGFTFFFFFFSFL